MDSQLNYSDKNVIKEVAKNNISDVDLFYNSNNNNKITKRFKCNDIN